ncbi:Lsr2 family DNA-binding protein [Streptomyces sp. NPDC003710]
MFTDMKEALAAEDLELTPLGSDQNTAASLVVARHARDKDDLTDLLGALGLPCGEDDLVTLLPHLTTPEDSPTGETMPTETVNAFTATAVSMLNNGDSPEHIRDTLGLSEDELADALRHAKTADAVQHTGLPAPDADTQDSTGTPETAAAAPDSTMHADGIEALLVWAESHPAAGIRNRAARVRSDLTELTERHATDAAQREAEERVAKAKGELEAAQAQLRAVKAGGHAATAVQDATPLVSAPAPAAPTGKRSKEELAAIRTWARANGHQVADRGSPSKAVLDAYDAAHRTTNLTEAS